MSAKTIPPTPKQAIAIILLAAVLWVPAVCLIVFDSQGLSPRQMAVIGAVNLVIMVSILILAYRKWIRYMR